MQPAASVPQLIARFLGLSLLGFVALSFSGVLLGLFIPFMIPVLSFGGEAPG
jgi:hypothetical protein